MGVEGAYRNEAAEVEKIATLPFHDARVRSLSVSRNPSNSTSPNMLQGAGLDWPADVAFYGALETEVLFRNSPSLAQSPRSNGSPLSLQLQRPFGKRVDSTESASRYYAHGASRPKSPTLGQSPIQVQPATLSNSSSDSSLTTREPIEDYEGIRADQVDRYGFFTDAASARRRLSSASMNELHKRTIERKQSMRFDRALRRSSLFPGRRPGTSLLPTGPAVPASITPVKEAERAEKWRRMAVKQANSADFEFLYTSKLVDRTFKGIPGSWRAQAWSSMLRHSVKAAGPASLQDEASLIQRYSRLLQKPCESEAQIALDVPRTISGHVLFRNRNAGGQRFLQNVLHAVTLQFPGSGYVQGMPSIAATLLCFFTEERAFAVMCWLWSERQMADLYRPGFPILMEAFKDLEQRMRPTVAGKHLLQLGILPITFATRWYLTLFHMTLPFQTQLRVWDIFILPPKTTSLAVLEAVTLALLDFLEDTLVLCDFDTAMRILTLPLPITDEELLVKHIRKRLR